MFKNEHILLVDTSYSHLHSFCTTGVSSSQGYLDSCVTGEVGNVCYKGVDLLLISFLYHSTWLLLGCVLNSHPVFNVFTVVKMWIVVFWVVLPFSLTGATSISEECITSIFRVKMRVGVSKFKLKMVYNDCAIITDHGDYLYCYTDLKIYSCVINEQLIISYFLAWRLRTACVFVCTHFIFYVKNNKFSNFLKTLWHGRFNRYF
jgi:hypothetical protein